MKEEELNKIALQILRTNGSNKWLQLVNTCNSMNIIICPILMFSKTQCKCRLYLNDFSFSDEGIGTTAFDSKCNVVDKFLNRYLNISKVSSCNKYVENNRDIHIDMFPNKQIVFNVANQINQFSEEKMLVKLADLCISEYTGDLWSVLNKYCLSENIPFYPIFSGYDTEFKCSFVFNKMKFEDENVVANNRINAGRILAERFIRKYASNYSEYEKKIERFFTFIAKECMLSKQNEYSKTLSSMCEFLNVELDKVIKRSGNKYICALILNRKLYHVNGEGSNENEAYINAIENFFANCFFSEFHGKIQNLTILNKIANFSLICKFADEWKSICNSCKLLGYKCHERFTVGNNTISMEFFVNGVSCGLRGVGQTRNEAGISLGRQFVEKFKDLKELFIESISQLKDHNLFFFVATLCMDKFWSNNWSVLTKICSKYNISLLKYVQNEFSNPIVCSMFIGIFRYENSVALSNHDLAYNLVTQHFFSNYGKRNLSENDMKALLKDMDEIGKRRSNKSNKTSNENKLEYQVLKMDAPVTDNCVALTDKEKLFRKIAVFCKSNPKSDDWKTLCNACRLMKQIIYEKFITRGSKFLCEVYINNQNINITETSTSRQLAARIVAQKFITKYFDKNFDETKQFVKTLPPIESIPDNKNSEQIFKNIANNCKDCSNNWDSFCKTCESLNYKMDDSCESDGKKFVCRVSVENILLNFTGEGSTRRNAKLSFVEQFLKKYSNHNEFSELNTPNQNNEDISSDNIISANNVFKNIADFCLLNPIKDDWKTFCNACTTLNCKMIERFISHDNKQFECEVGLNGTQITCGKKFSTRKDAAICTAKFFIQKYASANACSSSESSEMVTCSSIDESDQDVKIYEKIADLCQTYPYKDEWKALCNTCKLIGYDYQEKINKEENEFLCKLLINGKLLNLTGRGMSELKAAIDLAHQFMKKYHKLKVSDMSQTIVQSTNQKEEKIFSNNINQDPVIIPEIVPRYDGVYFLTY